MSSIPVNNTNTNTISSRGRGRGNFSIRGRGRGFSGNSITKSNPQVNETEQVPQSVRDLLIKWITGAATQEKIDIGMTKTGGKFANIYSWVSGENNLPAGASEQVNRQFTNIRRSYIIDNDTNYHKTRVYFSDPSVVKSIEDHFSGKYRVHLRKFKDEEADSLVNYRWVVQLETITVE